MSIRFRWTLLLTLLVASLVAAPLAVMAADDGATGRGLNSFQVRGGGGRAKAESSTTGTGPAGIAAFSRSFEPVLENLGPVSRRGQVITADALSTPSGYVRVGTLSERPRYFRMAVELAGSIQPAEDAFLVQFGTTARDAVRATMQRAGVTVLGEIHNNGYVVTGGNEYSVATLSRAGAVVLAWTPGLFTDPGIGVSPMPTAALAADPNLNLVASVFRGAEVQVVADSVAAMGGTNVVVTDRQVYFTMNVDALRTNLEQFTGLPVRGLAEQGIMIGADEETSTGITLGEFFGGRRPYFEAGVDGSTQVVAMTDTGVSLDAAVLASGGIGTVPGAAGVGHRKVVGYISADNAGGLGANPTGSGDLLTCDGSTGVSHGHLVGSLIAGNASDVVPDVRVLSGFETSIAGSATLHAIDGVASKSKLFVIDDQVVGGCSAVEQILQDAQDPGDLSQNLLAGRSFGISNGLDLKIHNLSFSRFDPSGGFATSVYTTESEDVDAFLFDNQDYLAVIAAGNRGTDGAGDGNLDFASITSPATAKNAVAVGSSGYPNNPLNLANAVLTNIPNNGTELISRFGDLSSSQGPAAFTISGLANDWRMKPDVMAPGDENLGGIRLGSPTTCISTDNDQGGSVECARLLPGAFFGTSFSAAAVSGAAAVIRDYFAKGYNPAGQDGAGTTSLTGPQLKAALIASTDLMTGNPTWRSLGGQLQLAFYTPRHLFPFTPEQGYGRVQLNKLLPLQNEPGTPSYIYVNTVALASAGASNTRTFTVGNPDEAFRCAAAWYDEESSGGVELEGNLKNDVDLTVTDCGADAICGNALDLVYYGNHFGEDDNFDRNLVAIPDELTCGGVPGGTVCDDDPDCVGNPDGTSCLLATDNPSEDCNDNGVLDADDSSLAIDPATVASACDSGARDRNNPNEAVFLDADQLTAGRTMQVRLDYVTDGGALGATNVGLVCTGGVIQAGTPNSVRGNKAEYSCNDLLEASILDGLGNGSAASVSTNVTIQTFAAGGGPALDSETGLLYSTLQAGTRFRSDTIGVSGNIPATNGDTVLTVSDGGTIKITYTDGADVAVAELDVRCHPNVAINNIARRGTNQGFLLSGGCDPRARMDPRLIVFSAIPGTGTLVTGDNFLDAGEDLGYTIAFTNNENTIYSNVHATLQACVPGTIVGGTCTPATGVAVLDSPKTIGTMGAGFAQTVTFNVRVDGGVTFPNQIQMLLQVSAALNGLTVGNETVYNHVLNVDAFDDPALSAAVDGVFRYSTDFPNGGTEIRILAAEAADPLDPLLDAETFVFDDATPAAGAGIIGNTTLLGFDAPTQRFTTPIANNWPWTFDSNNEGWAARRRFDSDPGANLELAARNDWVHSTSGQCGFQSNAVGQTDGQGGTGGIWHTGTTITLDPTRTGFDLGCENHEVPGDATDPKREQVLDVVSSPIFHRIHSGRDSNGFAYTVEFTRMAHNQQWSGLDNNAIFAQELDPDTTTPQPVDALDFGWMNSDQGAQGYQAGPGQQPHAVFNPNDPHETSSVRAISGVLDDTPPGQNIVAIHGRGSAGSFFQVGNPAKAPAHPYGEVVSFTSGRGFGLAEERGAGGLPLRNRDFALDAGIGDGTFEDTFGPNETRSPTQVYPITAGNQEVLVNRRDNFQVNMIAFLRENADPTVLAVPAYGHGFDDVVVEWVESHPVVDRTPCSNPASWVPDAAGYSASSDPSLAAGCASVAWDRVAILDPEATMLLTVIDTNARFGPDGIAQGPGDPGNDDQSIDSDGDGFAELAVFVNSDADIIGETFELVQTELNGSVYQGVVRVSSTNGLTSNTDGVIFIQENGDGNAPIAVNAIYADADITVSGVNGDNQPCPDNPKIDTAFTQFRGWDVLFVTAKVDDDGANSDEDNIADDRETVFLDITLVNSIIDELETKPDLDNVSISLNSVDPDVACILDGSSFYGSLLSGVPAENSPSDRFSFVVGDVGRTSATQVLQAEFTLGISASFVDGAGQTRPVSSFATPQRFSINLDLNVSGSAAPLVSNNACVAGANSGRACSVPGDCPGGTCSPIPTYLQSGGTVPVVAGNVGYFEGFEGSAYGAGAGALGSTTLMGAIAGSSFTQFPGINAVAGFLSYSPYKSPGALSTTVGADGAGFPAGTQGTSTVDGSRCSYNDPKGPQKHPRSEAGARETTFSDWHVTNQKAFSGTKSLRFGTDGTALGKDASFDSYHTNALAAAFSGAVNVGVAGGAALSIQGIVANADDRTFNVPDGNTADRAFVQVVETDAGGTPISTWKTISAFQNNYGNTGVLLFFVNVVFDPYDDFYDAEAVLGTTPGFDLGATQLAGVAYNADDISNEDDYFDPNDPQRLYGPSGSCFPQFAFGFLGDYTSTDPTDSGKAFTDGAVGSVGNGIWVNSLFSLDNFGGRTIKLRFVFTGIDISVNARWDNLFGNSLGNATRGWNIDDVAVSGLVSSPLTLVADGRNVGPGACPVDPDPDTEDNEAACSSITALAGSDVGVAVTGGAVAFDASASFADSCADGFLEYRWRVGGDILQDYSTNPVLNDTPVSTTVYSVDVRCSTYKACDSLDGSATDQVAAIILVPAEVSPPVAGTLATVVGAPTGFPSNGVGQNVLTRWFPPVFPPAFTVATRIFQVDVEHDGNSLRSGLGSSGCDDTPVSHRNALVARLKLMTPNAAATGSTPPGFVDYTDITLHVGAPSTPGGAKGEVVGYIAQASITTPGGVVLGTMGAGKSCLAGPAGFLRGSVNPATLPPMNP